MSDAEQESPPEPRCDNCIHWRKKYAESTSGNCLRYPPIIVASPMDDDGEGGDYSAFPETEVDDRCGEFRGPHTVTIRFGNSYWEGTGAIYDDEDENNGGD